MKADNIKNLLLGILIVLLLLSICVTVDYADDTITVTENQTVDKNINSSGIIVLNDTYYAGEKVGVAKLQSVVTEKQKLPVITMTGKPSCSRCARNHIPSFECRSKEVALKLCDFLNKASDDFKWQINQCEKWSAKVKQLKKENEKLREEKQRLIYHINKEPKR